MGKIRNVLFFIMVIGTILTTLFPSVSYSVQEGQYKDPTVMGASSPWAVSSGGTVFDIYDDHGNLKTVISGLTSISVDISGGTLASEVTVLNPVTTVDVSSIASSVTVANPVNTVAVSGITNTITIQGQISGITTVGTVTSITNPITIIPSGNISGITNPVTVIPSGNISGITNPVTVIPSGNISGITNPVTILASASGVTVDLMNYTFDAGTTVVNKTETDARKYGLITTDIHDVRIQQGRSWRIESVELNLGSGATKAYVLITSGATVETWLKVVIDPTYKLRYRVYNQPVFVSGTTLTPASQNPHMQAIGASLPTTLWYENPVYSNIGTKVKGEVWGTEETQQTPSAAQAQEIPWRILSVNQTLLFEVYSYYADNNVNIHFYFEEVQNGIIE